jgi:hypothetical protein
MNSSEIVIPKVFKEANFESSKDLIKKRSLSRTYFKESGFFDRKIKKRPLKTNEIGVAAFGLPFKVDGFVIHTYARPSRIVTECKEDNRIQENFNKDMKKIMHRFESHKFSRYKPKEERIGFQGWKRSQVFVNVVKRKGILKEFNVDR